MNSQEINEINSFLQSSPINRSYKVKVGKTVRIDLPKVPLTGATEFWQLETEIQGDTESLVAQAVPWEGEGILSPAQIISRAVSPGKVNISVKAVDSLSGARIAGVDPLEIEVDIE